MKELPGVWVHGPDLIVDKNLTVAGRLHLMGSKGDLFTWMDGVDEIGRASCRERV